jgi:riboflavin biosynthesis pyrimidine reductase
LGGRNALKGVAGDGVDNLAEAIRLTEIEWRRLGHDWLLTARVDSIAPNKRPR